MGKALGARPEGEWFFLEEGARAALLDALVVHLDSHLAMIRDGFALPDLRASAGQLDLFSLPAMRSHAHEPQHQRSVASSRRRSARSTTALAPRWVRRFHEFWAFLLCPRLGGVTRVNGVHPELAR